MDSNRRKFIRDFSMAAVGLGLAPAAFSFEKEQSAPFVNKITVFSKNLQWLTYDGMAQVARQIGFDGIDLTVRPNGHVLPENVLTDLPAAVNAIRKRGVEVYSITTAITDASETYAEDIVATMRDLGINYYRLNWFEYDKLASMEENLVRMKQRMEGLAKLNERYNVHGAYQNHAGTSFGASIWDLWLTLKDLDPQFIGCQFDIRHATVEGGNSWVNDFNIIQPYIKTVNIKDFAWTQTGKKWEAKSVPLGEGMVDFSKYLEMLRLHDYKAPMCIHFEYPLGGADQGASEISIPKEKIIDSMKTDLLRLREWLSR